MEPKLGKKRKLPAAEEERESRERKSCRPSVSERREKETAEEGGERTEVLEANHPWRNLQLILYLQNEDIPIHKKVELAFVYVNKLGEGADDAEGSETVGVSGVIAFLNKWIQGLLISSEKKIRAEEYKPTIDIIGSVLDLKCWSILKYCLDESLLHHVSLTFSMNFLRVVQCIVKAISPKLSVVSHESDETISLVTHCVSLVFSSHGGVLNENLDLWILSVNAVLELIRRIIDQKIEGSNSGALGIKLTSVVLEPFAKFLKIHPNKKHGFRDFVDKLLEPLLHLLDTLHTRANDPSMHNLVICIEEVLSHGLFHSSHMDGLLSLQNTRKYITIEDGKKMDSNVSIQSYHRHLFDKLENICVGKNVGALNGLGEMFRLFTHSVERQKGASGDVFRSSFEKNKINSEVNDNSGWLNGETRRSLFDFFIQVMEPLLLRLNHYLEIGLETGPALVDFQNLVSSAKKVIASFSNEKLYLRTEDITEGASLNFLKLLYDAVLSVSAKVIQKWISTKDEIKVLNTAAKELVCAVGYLVEIEYEVVGDDLESLWFMIISFNSLSLSLPHEDQHLVTNQTLHLGRQVVNLYSELRQVNTVIFTLSKVIRGLVLPEDLRLPIISKFKSGGAALNYNAYVESVRTLLCSQGVRLAISNAIVSIPEGQVGGFVRLLKLDISESLEWIKDYRELHFVTLTELFGRALCDIYTLVMDSITVTAGNSNLIRVSVEEMIKVLGFNMKSLVAGHQDSVTEFLSTVIGETQRECYSEYSQWIVLFFFRLYMSCRNVYRQAMSLVLIDTSEKMSAAMGDTITAFSGKDWLEREDWNYGEYFSWILDSPSSLASVLESISDIYLVNSAAGSFSPLLYVVNAMAIQRLIDLNRLIGSFEYLLQRNKLVIHDNPSDHVASSSMKKTIKRCKNVISSLRQEAVDLTNFLMGHLTFLSKSLMCILSSNNSVYKGLSIHPISGYATWQFNLSAINKKSMICALWWMICQSIDVWGLHATKKKLKLFLSLLIENILLSDNTSIDEFSLLGPDKGSYLAGTLAYDKSLEILGDTAFYEQRFLRRHIASSVCRILEKSVLDMSDNVGEVHFKSSPNWTEFLGYLEKSLKTSEKNLNINNSSSEVKSNLSSSKRQLKKCGNRQKSSTPQGTQFSDCIALFKFMCWMPKRYLTSKSFSLYATCFINIERFVLSSILDSQDSVYCKNYLCLFLSCRRALKDLITEVCDEMIEPSQSSVAVIFLQSSAPILWLFKSLSAVAVALQSYPNDSITQMKEMLFSLMDQTSYIFFALSKYQLIHGRKTLMNSKLLSEPTINVEGLNSVLLVAETLKEQMNLFCLRRKSCSGLQIIELSYLSAIISCSQSFWYGFISALDHIDSDTCNIKIEVSRSKNEPMVKLRRCADALAEFVDYFVRCMLTGNNECDGQTEQRLSGTLGNCSVSSANKDQTEKRLRKETRQSQNADFRNKVFSNCDAFDVSSLKKSLLQGIVRGENPEAAFFLRQLFFAVSVLLRLNLLIYSAPLSLTLIPIFVGISQILLVELGDLADVSSLFSLVCLDGVTKFFEVLASHLHLTDPIFSRDVYVKLVELHFIAIGKCITLQGKSAYLASHDTESSTKTLDQKMEFSRTTLCYETHCLDEFKVRLRMSFQAFVKKPTELHIQAAIKSLRKALVGMQMGPSVHYDISIGGAGGGKVSAVVAAGVDCLDMVLNFVTGRKNVDIIKTNIHGLVACLFNIILHLQHQSIFVVNKRTSKGSSSPDSGSIILMCVEVLTRVFGKHAIYRMNSVQVAQSLHIPGAIFLNIFQLGRSKDVEIPKYQRLMDNQDVETNECTILCDVDRKFSIDLFAASCRLLGTLIKHYKSEAERCVTLLEDSVSTLLHCLEMVNIDTMVKRKSFAWELDEAVRCAAFLRRIYEELHQQKEFFGRHCSMFLSSYIWTYSGCGPLKIGIGREVDEALRPGVYALIDACSPNDLQRLHTVFGEGPCRSTLANLQRDYKLNFQYEGKV